MSLKNTERFSDRVENYVRFRPHYPKEIITFLKSQIQLKEDAVIADIGSGTGISSEIFLQNGNTVYGIEPNLEMRKAAEIAFKSDKNFISIDGSAEKTTLKNESVDVIIVGQAFHWFNKRECKKEFLRIAKPNCHLIIMSNDRDLEKDFQKAYEDILKHFSTDYDKVNNLKITDEMIQDFFFPFPYHHQSFYNYQAFDLKSLEGRFLSSSYVPLEKNIKYKEMMESLKEIFNKFASDSKVKFEYVCNIYYGSIS